MACCFRGVKLYDYGNRFYDPELGRFHTIDPLADFYPGISPYSYAYDSPIDFADFYGMGPLDWLKNLFNKKKHLPFAPGKRKYKPNKGKKGKYRSGRSRSRGSSPTLSPPSPGSNTSREPVEDLPYLDPMGAHIPTTQPSMDLGYMPLRSVPSITPPIPKNRTPEKPVTAQVSFHGDVVFTPNYATYNPGDAWEKWLMGITWSIRRNSNINLSITISTNIAKGATAQGSGLTGQQLVDDRITELKRIMEDVYGIPGARLHFNKGETGAEEKKVIVEIKR